MKNLQTFIICILLIGTGYAAKTALTGAPTPPPQECNLPADDTDSIKKKFETIAHTDYEEYLALKTDAEKYKKADEILNKIMTLFLADLGLHIAHSTPSPTPAPTTAPSERNARIIPTPTPKPSPKYSQEKTELLKLSNEFQNDKFLKSSLLSDPKQGLFDATPATNFTQRVKGCFEGTSTINGRTMQMKLWLGNTTNSFSSIQNYKSVLLSNGNMTSHQSGQTQNSLLTLNSTDPNEFIFFPVPGTFYQFYYLPLEDRLIADNYSGQPNGTYKFTGTTSLLRGDPSCVWINEYAW